MIRLSPLAMTTPVKEVGQGILLWVTKIAPMLAKFESLLYEQQRVQVYNNALSTLDKLLHWANLMLIYQACMPMRTSISRKIEETKAEHLPQMLLDDMIEELKNLEFRKCHEISQMTLNQKVLITKDPTFKDLIIKIKTLMKKISEAKNHSTRKASNTLEDFGIPQVRCPQQHHHSQKVDVSEKQIRKATKKALYKQNKKFTDVNRRADRDLFSRGCALLDMN